MTDHLDARTSGFGNAAGAGLDRDHYFFLVEMFRYPDNTTSFLDWTSTDSNTQPMHCDVSSPHHTIIRCAVEVKVGSRIEI
jgi:hypothetical protein